MILYLLLSVFLFFLVSKAVKFYVLSPVYLYCLFLIISITFSYTYFYFYNHKFNLYSLDNKVTDAEFQETIKLYMLSFIFFMIGALTYNNLSKKPKRIMLNKSFADVLFFKFTYPSFFVPITKVLFFTIIILNLLTFGEDIFIRSIYLSKDHSRGLQLLIKILSLVIVVFLGLINHRQKKLSNLFFWVVIIFSLGTGSRITILYFLIYFILIFQSKGNNLLNKLTFAFHLLITSVLFSLLIKFRSFQNHGIIPYFLGIISNENGVISEFSRSYMFNIYYSFIFGVFATIETVKESVQDWSVIWVSVNPLPGSVVGFYEYVPSFMLNSFAPFSSHGQVFVMGKAFTAFFYFMIGLIFTDIEYRVRVLFDKGKKILAFIFIFLSVLHIVYSFEYMLRSSIRYFYYMYFLFFLFWLFKHTYKILPKKTK